MFNPPTPRPYLPPFDYVCTTELRGLFDGQTMSKMEYRRIIILFIVMLQFKTVLYIQERKA